MKRMLAVSLVTLLGGCHSVALKEEARHVRLVFTEARVEKCTFLGDVVGSEGRWYNAWLIANDSLAYSALNDLRNHAQRKDADTVYVPALTTLFSTSVTIIGQAYRCGP